MIFLYCSRPVFEYGFVSIIALVCDPRKKRRFFHFGHAFRFDLEFSNVGRNVLLDLGRSA